MYDVRDGQEVTRITQDQPVTAMGAVNADNISKLSFTGSNVNSVDDSRCWAVRAVT